ncbi:MAG TPA: transglutaminaseTgpA domain-containing protein [Acidimicrobiales bacterium]|nr:transglutaminaseTgpA domain-containing protein [Acidimicrobiales bacterium]
MRPAGVRPAAALVGLAAALFLAARTSGAGWVVVLMCGLLGLVVVALAWSAATVARASVVVLDAPRDATAGTPGRLGVLVRRAGAGVQLRARILEGSGPWCSATGDGRGPVPFTPGRRGVATSADVEVRGSAPLGLAGWRRRLSIDLPAAMEVGPRPDPVAASDLAAGEPVGVEGGGRGRPGHDVSRGVRTYLSGDPRRLVHWPATARWGELMVRETEDPGSPAVVIAVDLRGGGEAAERAASRAAGLAEAALAAGRPVTLNTAEAAGPRSQPVGSPVEVGRRLARAVATAAPPEAVGPQVIRVSAAAMAAESVASRRAARPVGGPGEAVAGRGSILERVRRVNARLPAEEDLRLRVAVLVAVMGAATAVLDQDISGPTLTMAVLVGIPAAFGFAYWSRHRSGHGTKLVIAVGAVAALGWFLHTLAGITGGTVADAQAPLAELLLAVQALHALDATARRDLQFSLFVSVVVMATAGILSVSVTLAGFLAVWAVAAATGLVLAHRSALAEAPLLPPEAKGPSTRMAARRPALVVAAALVGAVAVGMGLLFVVPPAGTARALTFPAALRQVVPVPAQGGLANPSLGSADPARQLQYQAEARAGRRVRRTGRSPFGYFGFSTFLDLGSRPRPDQTLVMRVRADRPAMWRAQTFDRWDGRTWTMSSQRSVTVKGQLPLDIPTPPGEEGLATGPEFVQSYYVVQPGPNLLFAAAPVSQVYVHDRQVNELTDGTLRSSVELGPGAVYTVVSRPPAVTAADLRRADADPAGIPAYIAARYGRPLPATARVRALARRVTYGAPTTFDAVLALEAWMGAHTRYTLNAPPLPDGVDAVDQFLFVDRRGFCEQIATSLVVMLRSLGVPSRLAVGYAAGLRNPFTGLFEVRADDAHAWAEVWFPGVGWEPFDPTAQVPLAGDAAESGAASGLGAYLSRVIPSVPVAAVAGVGGAAGAGGLGWLVARVLSDRRRRRRLPGPTWAASVQGRLDRVAARWGRPRRPADTVAELAAALRAWVPGGPPPADLERAARLIDRGAFAATGLPAGDVAWVEEILDELERTAAGAGPGPRS